MGERQALVNAQVMRKQSVFTIHDSDLSRLVYIIHPTHLTISNMAKEAHLLSVKNLTSNIQVYLLLKKTNRKNASDQQKWNILMERHGQIQQFCIATN